MKHADRHPTDSTSKPLSGQQIVLENPPNNWLYLGPHWKAIPVQLCLSVTQKCP